MGREDSQETGPYSRHAVEAFQAPECAARIAIGFDSLRQSTSHPWQPGDVVHRSLIQIDLFSGRERSIQGHGSLALSRERLSRIGGKKHQSTWRSIGAIPPGPNGRARQSKPQQEKNGATLWAHGPAYCANGRKSYPGKCGMKPNNVRGERSEVRGDSPLLPGFSDQRHPYIAHYLKRLGADLVQRIC